MKEAVRPRVHVTKGGIATSIWVSGHREGPKSQATHPETKQPGTKQPGTKQKPGLTNKERAQRNFQKNTRPPSQSFAAMAGTSHLQPPRRQSQGQSYSDQSRPGQSRPDQHQPDQGRPGRAKPVWRESKEKWSLIISCAGIDMPPADLALFIEAKLQAVALKWDS